MKTLILNVSKKLTDIIFPPKCLKCGSFLNIDNLDIHPFLDMVICEHTPMLDKAISLSDEATPLLDKATPLIDKANPLVDKPTRLVDKTPPSINDYILKDSLPEILLQFSQYFCFACFKSSGGLKILNKDDYKKQQCITTQSSVDDQVLNRNSFTAYPSLYDNFEVKGAAMYEGVIKESIHTLKYNGKTALAKPLSLLLFRTFLMYHENHQIDYIVPIPLYRWRMFKRGFNQSFLLIKNFRNYWLKVKGSYPKWEIVPELIVRKRNTKSQTGFNRKQRQKNVKGAFAVRKKFALNGLLKGKHIVLVDDVHTTGATTSEARNTLLEAGAESVIVMVLALV